MNRPDPETVRRYFEEAIAATPHKKDTPLGTMTVNGRFDHYMDQDTDTMWLGFALGVRYHRILEEKRARILQLINERRRISQDRKGDTDPQRETAGLPEHPAQPVAGLAQEAGGQ